MGDGCANKDPKFKSSGRHVTNRCDKSETDGKIYHRFFQSYKNEIHILH